MFKLFKKEKTKYGEKLLKCPRDNIYMDKIKKGNVIIDVCRKCNGMWLDDKEIEKLLEFQNKRKPLKKVNKPKVEGETK